MITVTSVKIDGSNVLIQAEEVGPDDHNMSIPVDAIGSRMVLYGLTSPERALDALIREHFVMMSDQHESPQTRDAAIRQHEQLKNSAITGCEDLRKAVINDNIDIIREAYSLRIGESDEDGS